MSSSTDNLGPDPSMDEILSSIRRILKEDERPQPEAPSAEAPAAQAPHQPEFSSNASRLDTASPQDEPKESVLILDPSMMVPEVRADFPPTASTRSPPSAANLSSMPGPSSAPSPSSPPAPFSAPIRPAAPRLPAAPPSGPARQAPRPASLPPDELLGETAAESASSHLGALMRSIPLDRGAAISHAGPTLEDVVRDELRPLLRGWLDTNLPPLVERIVRAEIERLVARTK